MSNKFVIIGAGNTAHYFAYALKKSNLGSVQIISRNADDAKQLASLYAYEFGNSIEQIDKQADACILAVSDDVIEEIAIEIRKYFRGLILHCSGSISIDVLDKKDNLPFGVIYPLQTISKDKLPELNEVPLLIEASSKDTLEFINSFAGKLSTSVTSINSDERLNLHLAAVIVSNFTNHLNFKAKEYLDKKNIDFDILIPLMKETLRKSIEYGSYDSQTGPARRNDTLTIDKHLKLLNSQDDLLNLYKSLSDSIQKTYI